MHSLTSLLIQGLSALNTRPGNNNIAVKRMGELDSKPFLAATKKNGSDDEVLAIQLCSQWEGYLGDPSWHPFKIVEDTNGNHKVQ